MSISNGAWLRISGTATGTTTAISNREGKLNRVILPGSSAGTIFFYDTDTTTGTTSATEIMSLNNGVDAIPRSLDVELDLKKGLQVVVTGTTDFVIVYE